MKDAARAARLRGELGARIRALRNARKLTQEVIAGRIGITPKYLSQLECGQLSPSWETVVAIAHHGFDIKVATLMFGIDEDILTAQVAMLWGIEKSNPPVVERTHADAMADGFQQLRSLLSSHCERESAYQKLLEAHPWMFGLGMYSKFCRHATFDDKNIPDFTLRRIADSADDILEIKQPFLKCFTDKGEPLTSLQTAWHQAERYLTFAHENRDYLKREKDINIENPRCWLLIGTTWTPAEAKHIRIKETQNPKIKVLTYDQLLRQAQLVLSVMGTATASKRPTARGPTASKRPTADARPTVDTRPTARRR